MNIHARSHAITLQNSYSSACIKRGYLKYKLNKSPGSHVIYIGYIISGLIINYIWILDNIVSVWY